MIKILKNMTLSLAVITACSGAVFADGNAFTPLNFDDVSYNPSTRTAATSNVAPVQTKTIGATSATASSPEVTGSNDMQSAILKLDNAQIEVRNELLNYRAKYNDVDQQYKLIKQERKALDKKVKSIEKRIKELDRIKEKTRQQMI